MMQSNTREYIGGIQRLEHRAQFVKQALPDPHVDLFEELSLSKNFYDQEVLWGQWTELFFDGGKIDWTAFAAVPLMQLTSLREDWFDPRPVWEYLLFLASHVDRIYFYYDRHPGPAFSSEESRWKEVQRREESRPWLRLAFHSFREFIPLLEERIPQLPKKHKELIFKLLWISLSFGKASLHASTQLQLQNWACAYQRQQGQGHTIPNHNQLGLFRA